MMDTIGFLGCGNMGGAIARAVCKAVDPDVYKRQGHGTGQGELGKKVVVLFTQAEHQRQRAGGRNAQRAGIGCASQHGSTVLKGCLLYTSVMPLRCSQS